MKSRSFSTMAIRYYNNIKPIFNKNTHTVNKYTFCILILKIKFIDTSMHICDYYIKYCKSKILVIEGLNKHKFFKKYICRFCDFLHNNVRIIYLILLEVQKIYFSVRVR